MLDQENRKKTSTKASSTGEVNYRREANTSINLTKVHTILMFNESSPNLTTIFDNPFTVIKFPVFNRTHGAIKLGF